MVSIVKIVNDIKNNGKYDALLDKVKIDLSNDNPTFKDMKILVENDPYYVAEYKSLNRWGELSSIHIKELHINEDDDQEVSIFKKQINKNMVYLKNAEEYELKQKSIFYLSWTLFIAIPAVFILDNLVRVFTPLDPTTKDSIFISLIVVLVSATWGYFKIAQNHKKQHKKYIQIQTDTREMISVGLNKGFFTSEEVYLTE